MATDKRNVTHVRKALLDTLDGLMDGSVKDNTAKAVASVSRELTSQAATQLRYFEQRQERADVPYLHEQA